MNDLLEKLILARKRLSEKSFVCVTSDMDWASEYAIETTFRYFEENQIPLTAFITNPSEVVNFYKGKGKVKCGIHPNFMPDSSQGSTYDEVLDYCFEMLPDARAFRAHRYYDVNDTMERLTQRGIQYESNICMLMDVIPPFLHRSNTINFPIFWEDGAYLYYIKNFDLTDMKRQLETPGLKVLNLHPMHFMLNTPYFSYTREIKDKLSRDEWNHLDESNIKKMSYDGEGITTFIKRTIDHIQKKGISVMFLDDVYNFISSQIL